jgi:lysophospholipase L1-like esterase
MTALERFLGATVRVSALLLSLAASAASVLTGTGHVPVASAQQCAQPHGSMVAYGHSYLRSPEIGGATASYATLAANALRVRSVIRAGNGDTSVDVAKLVRTGPTKWVPGSAPIVLIDSSINDILHQLPARTWTAALRQMLTEVSAAPAPLILLMRPLPVSAPDHPGHDPEVIEAYAEQQQAIADEFDTVQIVDASNGWNPQRMLSADGVHPNSLGERHIARAVQRFADASLCAP